MKVSQKVNIHNRFDIHIDNIETGEHREINGAGFNIVLDQMFTRLCNGNPYFVNIHFGTGAGTPVANRTSLFAHLGTKAAADDTLIKAVPVSSWKRKIVLNPEEYVGSIITEVGLAFGSIASNLVTHAMLKDAEGNPISITKTDTDVVTIYATVFVTLDASNSKISYLGLPSSNALINYLIGGTSAPTGSFGLNEIKVPYARLGSSPTVTWTADVANKKRKTNTVRFDINTGNGHVKFLDFSNVFTLELPSPGVFTGQPYTAVPVGIGDGVKKKWTLPSANINQASLALKLAGVLTAEYTKAEKYMIPVRTPNPASPPSNNGNGVALTPDGLVMAVAHSTSPFVTTYDWSEGAWVKRANPASLPPGTGNGVALTPDGLVMTVAHSISPFITTYDWSGGAWVKRADPASLPPNTVYGVALTPDGLVMAVAHDASPYVTTYDWSGGAWVKRANPASLPPSTGSGVALTPDGLVMAGAHTGSPYVTTYDWFGGAWVKRANPASPPPSTGFGVALTPDGLVMAVAHTGSPYVTTYDWSEGAWVKRANPASLPPSTGRGVALTPDGLVMAVAHDNSPFITTYDWSGGAWVKRANPASLPTSIVFGVALTPDGLVMAVAHFISPFVTTYRNIPMTDVDFTNPPANGVAITADYTVDGIHKTNQYVVDVSTEFIFGEGSPT